MTKVWGMAGMALDDVSQFIFGLRDGRCVASAYRLNGDAGELTNNETISEWTARGLTIVILDKNDPQTASFHEQMGQDARRAIEKNQPPPSI